MIKQCIICNKSFNTKNNTQNTCSHHCASILSGQKRRERLLKEWLDTGKLPYSKNTMIKVKSVYREYIEQQQNHRCAICGIKDIWNGKPIVFVLDHIDGDSSNHNRNNLRLVCPNCDSQLDTYKFKNSHKSQRDYRVYKNK